MKNPIYQPKGPAREYSPWAVNLYTGCPHGCTYCYVPAILRKTPEVFHSDVRPRPGILEAIERQLSSPDWLCAGGQILLCFTCDPYPVGHDSSTTREAIRLIKDSGNHVSILTKGDETAQRDFDLLDEHDAFGVTWSGADFIGHGEPGAAHHKIRHQNLVIAKDVYGIPTWISCEPVLDPASIYAAIKSFECVDLWQIGKLNHKKSNINWADFGHTAEMLCQEYGREYKIKEALRKEMDKP